MFLTLTSERLGGPAENKTAAKARNMLTYFVTKGEIISTENTYSTYLSSNPNPIEPVTVITNNSPTTIRIMPRTLTIDVITLDTAMFNHRTTILTMETKFSAVPQ